MKRVCVIGSLNKDLVSYVKKVPKIGETIRGKSFQTFNGGKGANQAVAIAKMQVPTSMIGAIGNDSYGYDLVKGLKEVDINCDGVLTIQDSSGIASIIVDDSSNNSIIYTPGANEKFLVKDLSYFRKNITNFTFVVSQLEMKYEVVLEAFKIARENNKINILTPAPATYFSKDLLKYTNFLVPNQIEFESIFGLRLANKHVELVSQKFPNVHFVITVGENGVMYAKNGVINKYAAIPVKAIDTTAAGDSFLGAFVSQLFRDQKIHDAIKFGIKAAAITVKRKGAQKSLPSLDEVE